MRTLRLVLCTITTLLALSCDYDRTQDTSQPFTKYDHVFTEQAPWNQPNNLSFEENLSWLTREQSTAALGFTYEDGRAMGPDGEISPGDLKNFFYTYYTVSDYAPWQNLNCVQLVRNSAGGRFLMFHNQPCTGEEQLLDSKSLRFYLIVDENEYDLKKGFNDFEARSIFYKGFRVGSLAKGRVDGKLKHFLGDLCQSEGAGNPRNFNGLSDDASPSAVCSALIAPGHRVSDLMIRSNRSGSVRPLRLTGFSFSKKEDPTSPVEMSSCIEETVPGMACAAIGSAMSDRCSGAGLRLINCRNCQRICDGRF